MKSVLQFPLRDMKEYGAFTLTLPRNARAVSVSPNHDHVMTVFVEVPMTEVARGRADLQERRFLLVCDGDSVPDDASYVASFHQHRQTGVHLFALGEIGS